MPSNFNKTYIHKSAMQLKTGGIQGDQVTIKTEEITAFVIEKIHALAKTWAPENARSYQFKTFRYTDKDGSIVYRETPRAYAIAVYFDEATEGEYRLDTLPDKMPVSTPDFSISGPCELINCRHSLTKGYCLSAE